jgi:hypothetical protein
MSDIKKESIQLERNNLLVSHHDGGNFLIIRIFSEELSEKYEDASKNRNMNVYGM